MAADAGELHGACWAWETLKVTWANAFQRGDINVVLQVTTKKYPTCPMFPRRSTWPRPTKRACCSKPAPSIPPPSCASTSLAAHAQRPPADLAQRLRQNLHRSGIRRGSQESQPRHQSADRRRGQKNRRRLVQASRRRSPNWSASLVPSTRRVLCVSETDRC